MTVYDLTELDLAYAPPYSSAKDPLNMIGYVMENLLTDKVRQIHWQDIDSIPQDAVILDARTDMEYRRGHLDSVMHIPVDEIRDRMEELPKDMKIYVYCQSGLRSYIACRILKQKDLNAIIFLVDMDFMKTCVMAVSQIQKEQDLVV